MRAKLGLTKRTEPLALAGIALVLIGGLWMVFFSPLITSLNARTVECAQLEGQAAQQRSLAAAFRGGSGRVALIGEEEISRAIDEVTRKGKLGGVTFVSITPGKPELAEAAPMGSVPVELETRSSYPALGALLGKIQELETVSMKIRRVGIRSDSANPSEVAASLSLDVYIAS